MAEDLGTWPPEQATVLLEVLQKAGLTPQAKRAKGGITVTVPDDQSDEAHRQLVANMDTIANAARRPRPAQPPRGRRPRPVKGADNTPERNSEQLASQRLRRIALIVAVIVITLIVLRFLAPINPILAVGAVGALIYFLGRRAQRQGGDEGPSGPTGRW